MLWGISSAKGGRAAWQGAFALLAAVLVILATPAARAEGIVADRFSSNGDAIQGWYWLRDPMANDYAEFTWDAPPAGDLLLEFSVLATNRVDGGPGVNAHFDLSVGYPGSGNMGGVFKKIGVTLQNTGNGGAGYMNHGYYTLRRDVIDEVMPVNGQLFIRVQRGSQRGPHIALRADSIRIVGGPTLGDLSGGMQMGDELLRELLDDAIQGGGWWDDTLLRDFLTELLRDTRGMDQGRLFQLLELLLEKDGDDNADRLRDMLDQLLLGEQLRNELLLRELLDQLLQGGGTQGDLRSGGGDIVIQRDGDGTLPDDRRDDDTLTDMRPDLGDWGDEGQCFLDRPCLGDAASGFRSTGFPGVEGWFWLRTPTVGQHAAWVFEQPPEGALVLDISGLAQNVPGHVRKDTAHVLMTLGYPGSGSLGGQIGPFTIALPMIWKEPDTDIWKTRALVTIPPDLASAVIPVTGGLYVHIERVDANEPDVGFSAGSVLLAPAQSIGR